MIMKELVIVTKDRVGLLADISEALGKGKVNIESVSADVVGKNAVVRLMVSDDKKGNVALTKAGFKPVSEDTVVITLDDRPGELSRAARILSEAGVGMTNVFHLSKEKGKALVALRVQPEDLMKAKKLLKEFL